MLLAARPCTFATTTTTTTTTTSTHTRLSSPASAAGVLLVVVVEVVVGHRWWYLTQPSPAQPSPAQANPIPISQPTCLPLPYLHSPRRSLIYHASTACISLFAVRGDIKQESAMTSFQSSPYSSNYSNFPASPFPSSSSSPVRFDRPLYIEETASSPAYIESLETAELALVQHLKTAGLRKQRELALIDEVMKIRTERKKIFSALNKVLSRQKAECTRVGKILLQ